VSTLLTPLIIAKEALIALENECVLGSLMHHGYSKEYQSVGATVIIRKPTTFSSTAVSDTINLGTAVESSVAVVLDKHLDVTWEVSTQELSLDVVNFSEQFIQPAMRAHAQTIDAYCANLISDIAAHKAVSATPVVGDITGLRAVMNVKKAPLRDRRLVLHPDTEASYLGLDAFLHADKKGDGGRAVREAELGRVLGFDCYMDQNIITHTQGGYTGGGTATVVCATTATAGQGTIGLKSGVASSTIAANDVFKSYGEDEWYRVTTAATAGTGGLVGVIISPVLKTALAADATVTFQETHKANMAFHKNAFAVVTAPLAPPLGGAKAGVINYKGWSCRVVYDYTMTSKKNMISIDILLGFKTLEDDLAARLCDSN